jgi:hypothetical protein
MDILTTTTLLGLNPDVEKSKFLNESILEDIVENEVFFDLKKTYFFVNNHQSKIDHLKNHIATFLENINENEVLSLNVVNNAFNFLDRLNSNIVDELNFDNVYTTSYGTIVFDYENKNESSVFSLEIGKKEIGYFIEKNDIDIKQVDAVEIEKINEELITDLINFFE